MSNTSSRRSKLSATAARYAIVTLLTACSHDVAAPSSAPVLTSQQAMQVGGQLSREISASVGSITARGVSGLALRYTPSLSVTGAIAADVASPCPAPDNTNDSDHDGIPDSAAMIFALPQCRTVANGDTTEVTGSVLLRDPVFSPPPDVQAFGYLAQFRNFTVRVAAATADSSFTMTRNGIDHLIASAAGTLQEHGFDITLVNRAGTAHITDEWHALFAPVSGTTLTLGAALPRGFLRMAGSTTWQRGVVGQQFTIATVQPLDVDPGCPVTAATRIRSGEVHASLNGSGPQAVVRLVFADCGEPTITTLSGS